MMLFRRNGILTLAALILVAGLMSGCSKKTSVPDITQDGSTRDPVSDTGSNPGDGSSDAPVDVIQDDSALKDVYFDYDDYTLSADARSRLAGNSSYLREMSSLRATIEGHCDERGTVEYNLALGQRRADAVKKYLVSLGMDSGRLSTVSYGKERPFDPGHDEGAWRQNRRAHFVVNR